MLSWEQNIHVSLYKPYLDKLDKLIFKKRGLKALFSVNHGAAISTILKNAALWMTEKNTFNPFC